MDLFFFTEARFLRFDGKIWTDPVFSINLWQRYLTKFEIVNIVARVNSVDKPIEGKFIELQSDRIRVVELDYYIGLSEFLKVKKTIQKKIKEIIKPNVAYICRVPGMIGYIGATILRKHHIPYALEIVGDPWESLSYISLGVWYAPILQHIGKYQLQSITSHASAVLYVTEHILQDRYRPRAGVYTTYSSNVILKDDNYSESPKTVRESIKESQVRFLAIGSLAQMYKAPDVVLSSMAKLQNMGLNVYLTWFGDGKFKASMIQLAKELNIINHVNFAGTVTKDIIQKEFERTDIYLHVAHTEGLPRALVEAMAYGLPCIGSAVGGIPELLDEEAIIKPNNSKMLVNKIQYFIADSALMQQQADRNWNEAHKYHNDILTLRRDEFYDVVKNISRI